MAPCGLAQLLHWPGCHTVDGGLKLQEAAVGKARTRVGQGHGEAVHTGSVCARACRGCLP